ncbi:MAG: hypothetical protein E7380_05040 [Clostridiales bacterium]|nr:hypothetical protein [Clostridiales bacterium]
MRKTLYLWQLVGLTFTAVAGTLLHFLYPWTQSRFVASFSAVNESVWEHMKLLFFPAFLFAFVEYLFLGRYYKNFWQTKLCGILLGVSLIPALFYTYNGALGVSPAWINILIFFLAAFLAFYWEGKQMGNRQTKLTALGAILLLFMVAIAFVLFTFFTPPLPLFLDPITGGYGL